MKKYFFISKKSVNFAKNFIMKKIFGILLIFSVLAGCGLFWGCDSWPAKIITEIDQESKDYCLFNEGSYWIYQDVTTFEKDSIVISNVSYEKETSASYTGPSFGYEYYTMNITTFLCNHNNLRCDDLTFLTSANCDKDKVEKNIFKPIQLCYRNHINELYNINSDYVNYHNGELYDNFDNVLYENFHENYSINNKTFLNIKVFLTSFYNSSYQIRTYWVKNVGIIRFEYIASDTIYAIRNLTSYNVSQ
jgi:hypothetical protein